MAAAGNSNGNAMQGLLPESDNLITSEITTLEQTSLHLQLTEDYRPVAGKVGLEIDTRKWEVFASFENYISTHVASLSPQAPFRSRDILVKILFDRLRAVQVDLAARSMLIRETHSLETHIPGTGEIVYGNADCENSSNYDNDNDFDDDYEDDYSD